MTEKKMLRTRIKFLNKLNKREQDRGTRKIRKEIIKDLEQDLKTLEDNS